MEFYYKILKFTKRNDPRTWWREYPPKFIYKKNFPDEIVESIFGFFIPR